MARIKISVTNNNNQDKIELPNLFGGYDVDPSTTISIEADAAKFNRLKHDDEPTALRELEKLDNQANVEVSIEPIMTLEEGDLEEQLEAAQAFGALAGRQLRVGSATFTTADGASQTFSIDPAMPDDDYEVIFSFTGNFESGTPTDAQVPRVASKSAGEFTLEMNAAPAADADFAFAILANPANPS